MVGKSKPNTIIGLGNPGSGYKNTYHNVGRLFVEHLAKKIEIEWQSPKNKNFKFAKNKKLVLVETLEFMNQSGKSVAQALKFFARKPANVIIAHDDSDLCIGRYKLSQNKNSAGHKGVESVIKELKTKNFWRLRIGVRPENERKRLKAGDFVLKKISKKDAKKFYSLFDEIIEKPIFTVVP